MEPFVQTLSKLPENVLVALLLAYGLGRVTTRVSISWEFAAALAKGLLFGVAAAVCMSIPFELQPGVIVDLRNLIVLMAGPFAGPVAAVVAAVVAGAYRLWLGGIGAWAGVGALVTAAALGSLIWKLHGRLASWPAAALAGAALAITTTPWLLTIGDAGNGWIIFRKSALSLTLLYVLGSVAIASLLTRGERGRSERHEQAADMRRLRAIVDTAHDWSWNMDPALRFTEVQPASGADAHLDPQSMIGERPRDLLGSVSEAEIEAHEATLARRLPFRDVVHEYRTRAGEKRSMALSGRPAFASDGTFQGYRGSGRDVTDEERRRVELLRAATIDSLTGVPNRRSTQELLDAEVERVRRYERNMALIWFDIDCFKQINDSYGHAAGDSVLRDVAQLVASRLRRNDVIGRWGGDEFLIVLPEASADEAVSLAEALREQVERMETAGDINVTLSLGIAENDGHVSSEELLERADKALYEAKKSGRNRTAVVKLPGTTGPEIDWIARRRGG